MSNRAITKNQIYMLFGSFVGGVAATGTKVQNIKEVLKELVEIDVFWEMISDEMPKLEAWAKAKAINTNGVKH